MTVIPRQNRVRQFESLTLIHSSRLTSLICNKSYKETLALSSKRRGACGLILNACGIPTSGNLLLLPLSPHPTPPPHLQEYTASLTFPRRVPAPGEWRRSARPGRARAAADTRRARAPSEASPAGAWPARGCPPRRWPGSRSRGRSWGRIAPTRSARTSCPGFPHRRSPGERVSK